MTHKKQRLNLHEEIEGKEHADFVRHSDRISSRAPATTNVITLFVLRFVSSFKETFRLIYVWTNIV